MPDPGQSLLVDSDVARKYRFIGVCSVSCDQTSISRTTKTAERYHKHMCPWDALLHQFRTQNVSRRGRSVVPAKRARLSAYDTPNTAFATHQTDRVLCSVLTLSGRMVPARL